MLNLLPEQDKKKFISGYRFRFAVISAVFVCLLLVVAVIGLMPSYVSQRSQIAQEKEHAEAEKNSGPTIEEAEAKVAANKVLADYLESRVDTIEKVPALSDIFTNVFTASGPTIRVNGLDVSGSVLTVHGVASTRDELISFHLRLKKEPYFKTALLPISDIAKSVDAPFTIQVVLPL